ncbi:MAG: hypothetical protein RL131_359, partial [Bacteroidota bacterium]
MDFPSTEMSNKELRPRFLTFLCYLTMFASTYMIFSSIGGIADPEAVTRQMNDALSNYEEIINGSQPQNEEVEKAMEKIISDISSAIGTSSVKENNIFTLIINTLSLIGAWLMLRLRKIGFHFYLVSNLLAVAAPLLVFGSGNILGYSLAIYYGVTGLLFVILYA